MSNSKKEATHTAGPWSRDKYGHIVDASGKDVMFRSISISCAGNSVAEAEKNSDLTAAAPELLALLVESQESIGGNWRARRDAVIAKALGEVPA